MEQVTSEIQALTSPVAYADVADAEHVLPRDAALSVPPIIDEGEHRRVRKLLRRVGRKNRVRRLAEHALRGEAISSEEIEQLIQYAADPSAGRWRRRQIAAWTLAHVPLDAAQSTLTNQVLCRVLSCELPYDKSRMVRLCMRWVSIVLALTACLAGLTSWTDGASAATSWIFGILASILVAAILMTLFFMPVASLITDDRYVNRVRAEAARSLGLLCRVESVDALAEAIGPLSAVRRPALTSLRAVLPLLRPEHYGQLKTDTVPDLCQYLLTQSDEGLVLLALTALEAAGDGRAVAPVERLTHLPVFEATRSGADDVGTSAERPRRQISELIWQRALSVLPILEERREREQASGMLLRGSEEPVATPDQLVRAVDSESFTPPDQLLRARSEE